MQAVCVRACLFVRCMVDLFSCVRACVSIHALMYVKNTLFYCALTVVLRLIDKYDVSVDCHISFRT